MLGPWPALELVRSYLPLLVSTEILLAIFLCRRKSRTTRSIAAIGVPACYLTSTALLVLSIFKTLLIGKPSVDPELLAVMPYSHYDQYPDPDNKGAIRGYGAQIVVLVNSIQSDETSTAPIKGYESRINLPELGVALVFKGSVQVVTTDLSSFVRGLDAWPRNKPSAMIEEPITKSEGGLIRFQLVKPVYTANVSSSDINIPLAGYLAFMRLPDGNTLGNLRASKAYLRRLGALVRHLEGPIIILLDSRLSLFHKQIPYLEKVGRVKLASLSGNNPSILLPTRNLVVFKR